MLEATVCATGGKAVAAEPTTALTCGTAVEGAATA